MQVACCRIPVNVSAVWLLLQPAGLLNETVNIRTLIAHSLTAFHTRNLTCFVFCNAAAPATVVSGNPVVKMQTNPSVGKPAMRLTKAPSAAANPTQPGH